MGNDSELSAEAEAASPLCKRLAAGGALAEEAEQREDHRHSGGSAAAPAPEPRRIQRSSQRRLVAAAGSEAAPPSPKAEEGLRGSASGLASPLIKARPSPSKQSQPLVRETVGRDLLNSSLRGGSEGPASSPSPPSESADSESESQLSPATSNGSPESSSAAGRDTVAHNPAVFPPQATLSSTPPLQLQAMLRKLHDDLLQHSCAEPFAEPVDTRAYRDYRRYVKQPMDLQTISANLSASAYKHPHEYFSDVRLVFDNSRSYNTDEV